MPAGELRTWWSQGSLLTKLTFEPTRTTVTAGMNCIFSWLMVACAASGVFGAAVLLAGTTTTTASCTGLPSLSSTDTTRLPACADAPNALKASSAEMAVSCVSAFMAWLRFQVA
jgi:hypothetical protein